MAFPRALLPGDAVLATWATISDAKSWANIDEGLARSVFRHLGDPDLGSLAVAAVIPTAAFERALGLAMRGTRALSEVEKGQFRLMMNAIRCKYGALPIPVNNLPAASGVADPLTASAMAQPSGAVAAARRLLAVAENDSGRPDSPFLATEGVGEVPTKAAMVEDFPLGCWGSGYVRRSTQSTHRSCAQSHCMGLNLWPEEE